MTCFVSKPSIITLVELSIISTSYQNLPFGSGDYPDKLLPVFHQALNEVSNSSDRELPRVMFRSVVCTHGNDLFLSWYRPGKGSEAQVPRFGNMGNR